MNERELLARRANWINQARAIHEAAKAEGRDLTAAEEEQYNAIMDKEVAGIDKTLARERQLAATEGIEIHGAAERPESGRGGDLEAEKKAKAWSAYLRTGVRSPEMRALQADSDAAGGYTVAPQQFVNDLIMAVDNMVFIRQWATKTRVTTAQSLGLPYLAADPDDADWTSELLIGDEDSDMDFGKRELYPHPLAKLIKVSNKLLRMSPNVDNLVIQRLSYKFGVSQEKAHMTGNGSGQPLGLFTASNNGIPTSRDVSSGNTTTSIQFDGIKEAKFTLKQQYWARARWLFHRDAVKQIAKLQDDTGRYIWQPAVAVGQPDTLEGFPVAMSEYAPNTFTTGLYVGMLADFAFYHIADALDFGIQRLVELYAVTNQVGFIGRLESDGMPVLAEAFVRVKLA